MARSYQLLEKGSMSKWFWSESVEVAVRLRTGETTSSHWLARNADDWKKKVPGPPAPPGAAFVRLKVPSVVVQPSAPASKSKVCDATNWESPSVPAGSGTTKERTAGASSLLVTSTRKRMAASGARSTARNVKAGAVEVAQAARLTPGAKPVTAMPGWLRDCAATTRTFVSGSAPVLVTGRVTATLSQLSM